MITINQVYATESVNKTNSNSLFDGTITTSACHLIEGEIINQTVNSQSIKICHHYRYNFIIKELPPDTGCIAVMVYWKDPDTGKVYAFGDPCSAPQFYDPIRGHLSMTEPTPTINNNTTLVNSPNTFSIISVQPTDQQGNPVSTFAKGRNGFVKVTLSSQSNQTALTTVDLIGSDLTSLGTGSIKNILNQATSEMTLSFFIPDSANNGPADICVDVYSDWLEKGGFPLAPESCVKVQIGSSTLNHGNNTVGLQEIITINSTSLSNVANSTTPTQDIDCSISSSNQTQEVQLNRDNYSQSLVTLKAGQKVFPLLVQKICRDHVVGLEFYAVPLCCPSESVILHIGDSVGGGCTPPQLTLVSIQGKTATFSISIHGVPRDCPVCLSGNTTIDTPNGPINVKELKIGMPVWTTDSLGHKQFATILKTGKTLVPTTHKMDHIVLNDGRELYASEGHPTTDGRFLGGLSTGDILDNSRIRSIGLVFYNANYTYDILPSGPTGFYWANGILVGSTLK